MNTSSESAEQMVKISLQGMEVALRVSGSATKNIIALLIAIAKDQEKVKGKTNITNMLKSGKPLKVFCVKEDDLRKFSEEAKKYGILYSIIVDKNSKDSMVDIMVREEDASKINRIIDKFKLATVDIAKVKSEVDKIKEEKETEDNKKTNNLKAVKESNGEENPSCAPKKKKNQSENSLVNKENLGLSSREQKPSVREELKKIVLNKEAEEQSKNKISKHIQPKMKKGRRKKNER